VNVDQAGQATEQHHGREAEGVAQVLEVGLADAVEVGCEGAHVGGLLPARCRQAE
jgi:hypothetical protein